MLESSQLNPHLSFAKVFLVSLILAQNIPLPPSVVVQYENHFKKLSRCNTIQVLHGSRFLKAWLLWTMQLLEACVLGSQSQVGGRVECGSFSVGDSMCLCVVLACSCWVCVYVWCVWDALPCLVCLGYATGTRQESKLTASWNDFFWHFPLPSSLLAWYRNKRKPSVPNVIGSCTCSWQRLTELESISHFFAHTHMH